jgi:hypothetical protein
MSQAVTQLAESASARAEGGLQGGAGRAESTDERGLAPQSASSEVAGSSGSVFQPDAEARALANDVDRLRAKFLQAKGTDALALAEALGEVIRQDSGLEAALQCAAFVGQDDFDDLIGMLSPKQALDLRSYFDSQHAQPLQTLRGADACRMILAQGNTRLVEVRSLGDAPLIREARQALLGVDDSEVMRWLQSEPMAPAVQWAFGAMTPQRMLQIMRALAPEVARTFGTALDKRQTNDTTAARLAAERLRGMSASASRQEMGRTRLVQRLIAQSKLDDEILLASLFNGPDWPIRRYVAHRCYLLSDLEYLAPSFLLGVIDRKKVADRAALLYLLPAELRNSLLNTYPKDSKALEVVTLELANIDTNSKRRAALLKNRRETIESFLKELRSILQSNTDMVDQALRAMAAAKGWPLPPELEPLASSVGSDGPVDTQLGAA